MALVVEDGTGKVNAESYAAVADFQTFFNNRGVDIAALEDLEIEQLLRKATDYLQGYYRGSWKGVRNTITQALDWPRYNVTLEDVPGGWAQYPAMLPNNVIPNEIKNACSLLAYKAQSVDLAPDIDRVTKSEKIDVLEVVYDTSRPAFVMYRDVAMLLAPYLGSSAGAGVSLVRC